MDSQTLAGILAFRDGAPTEKETRRLIARDPEALRALIDARMLALALALPTKPKTGAALPPTDLLLEYLTSPMSDEHRAEREAALRGNARAFAALLTMRKTLKGLPRPPERLPLAAPRIDLGELKYRVDGPLLRFESDEPEMESETLALFQLRVREDRELHDYAAYEDFTAREDDLEVLLARVASLIEEARARVADAEKTGRTPDAKQLYVLSDALRELTERLSLAAKMGGRPRRPARAMEFLQEARRQSTDSRNLGRNRHGP